MNSEVNNNTFRKEWNEEVQNIVRDLNATYELNIQTMGDSSGFIRYISDFDKELHETLDISSFRKVRRINKEQIELFFKKCSSLEKSTSNLKDFRDIKFVCKINNDILIIYKDNSSIKKSLLEATEQERFMLSYFQAMQLLKMEKELLWTTGECICEPDFELKIKRKENSEDIITSAFKGIVITGKKLV